MVSADMVVQDRHCSADAAHGPMDQFVSSRTFEDSACHEADNECDNTHYMWNPPAKFLSSSERLRLKLNRSFD